MQTNKQTKNTFIILELFSLKNRFMLKKKELLDSDTKSFNNVTYVFSMGTGLSLVQWLGVQNMATVSGLEPSLIWNVLFDTYLLCDLE